MLSRIAWAAALQVAGVDDPSVYRRSRSNAVDAGRVYWSQSGLVPDSRILLGLSPPISPTSGQFVALPPSLFCASCTYNERLLMRAPLVGYSLGRPSADEPGVKKSALTAAPSTVSKLLLQ